MFTFNANDGQQFNLLSFLFWRELTILQSGKAEMLNNIIS